MRESERRAIGSLCPVLRCMMAGEGLQARCWEESVARLELLLTTARQKVKLETQDSVDLCWLHTVTIYTSLPEHKPQLKQPNKTPNLKEPASSQ